MYEIFKNSFAIKIPAKFCMHDLAIKYPTPQSADELRVRSAAGHPRHGAGHQQTHGHSHYCQAQGCQHVPLRTDLLQRRTVDDKKSHTKILLSSELSEFCMHHDIICYLFRFLLKNKNKNKY